MKLTKKSAQNLNGNRAEKLYNFDGNEILKNEVIQALIENRGLVTVGCRAIGVPFQYHYKWLKNDPEYARAFQDVKETICDWSEGLLHDRMIANDTTAIIFHLKYQARHRGYNMAPEPAKTDTSTDEVRTDYDDRLKDYAE